MAGPCFALGLMSINTTWDSGTKTAPHTRCRSRAATISANEFDRPHSLEARVKPPMEAKNIFCYPKRSTSHPVRGGAMTAATM